MYGQHWGSNMLVFIDYYKIVMLGLCRYDVLDLIPILYTINNIQFSKLIL